MPKSKSAKVLKFSSYFDFLSIFIYCTINKIKSFFLGKREIMKSKLGMTLRKVRKGKQVSLSSVADEHLSKSQISRFERGESEISCARLINILDKLHISFNEFLILHDQDYTKTELFANLVQYIRKQYSSQDINNIVCLLSDSSNYTLNSFEKTMVKSILYTMDSTIFPSDEELLQLTDYLFKVEKWGYYEIILLGNCVRTINYKSYFLLTKEMLNNYLYSSLNKTNKRIVTQLAINCFILSIDKEEFSNCSYLISEIKSLLDNELNFYEQTVFLYATGYFEFKRQSSSGIKKMKQAIQVLDILGEDKLKLHYTNHFNKLTNKE